MFHVVDDELLIRELLKSMITGAGYGVRCFDSALSYLEHTDTSGFRPPTALITDYKMPEMNGYELMCEVRKRFPFMRVVLVSGAVSPSDLTDMTEMVCYGMSKPFRVHKLVGMLDALHACEQHCSPGENCY
ncbi:MAG: response regulator, partial [Mariprofundus sp.]